MGGKEITHAIIIATVLALVFIAIIISFVLFYRNRKRRFQQEKEAMHRELLHAKIEVQEQTLQHFCRELHDDIGQKLSVARILINKMEAGVEAGKQKEELAGISELLGEAIGDMRTVINTLNPDAINRYGFTGSLANELGRITKSGLVKGSLQISGESSDQFTPQQELLLFRICQEFIQNSLKHAHCSIIAVHLYYNRSPFEMHLSDNGQGFTLNGTEPRGNGLKNMINRAKLLGGNLQIQSEPGAGTTVHLILPLNA